MTALARLLAVGSLALVASTWKLWTPQDVFPQVPLIRAACDWPGWFDWVCLSVLVASSLTLLIVARRGWWGRGACIALAVSLAGFFVLDQHRLQPWAWQFFLLAVLLSLADDDTARRGWRWLVVGIYFWSAASKLDYTFFHEQGPALLGGLKQAMGLRGMPNRWTEALDIAGSVGIALGELGVAMLLAWPRTRWLGLWAATIMHLALLAALGPFGLNHSLGVLLWNVFFIVQDWLLFREAPRRPASPDEIVSPRVIDRLKNSLAWPVGRNNRLALGGLIAVLLWPSLQPFGYCHHWLAWAVYSPRSDALWVFVEVEDNIHSFPDGVIIPEIGMYSTRLLDVRKWSLNELGAPVNPQHELKVGIAIAVASRYRQLGLQIRMAAPPNRWTGKEAIRELSGIDELKSVAGKFIINAHPRRTTFFN